MDFEPCFKIHNLVSLYPKSIKLGEITTLNPIFDAVYRLDKFKTRRPANTLPNIRIAC